MLMAVDRLAKGIMAVIHKVALLRTEVSALQKANKELSKRRRAKKRVYGLEGHLRYKRHRIYWIRGLWVSSWLKKHDKVVVVPGSLVRRFSVVACTVRLAIIRALTRRLQNRLIHLFPIYLLLFLSVMVV